MLILALSQALFGAAALVFSAVTCHSVLRADKRAHLYLTITGSIALVFFVSLPGPPVEMIALSLLTLATGIILTPRPQPPRDVSFDSTATRRRR